MVLHSVQGLSYELVVRARAKRASLRVVPGRGVVVSIPKRFPQAKVREFVESNSQWIKDSLAEIDASTPAHFRCWPPQGLPLPAIGQQLVLDYVASPRSRDVSSSCTPSSCEFSNSVPTNGADNYTRCISSPIDDKAAVAQEIADHLKQIARTVLPPLLASYAQLHALSYKRVSIRGQRTVWGSYSSSGTLSLNYKLLFLSRELVDYVLLHELAHTVHLNHSEDFWHLLRQLSVNARGLDRRLSQAGKHVPPWLELAR